MPVYRTYQQGNLKIGIWKTDEAIEQLRSMLNHFSWYESDYAKFTSDKRRQEWLAVRVLLKELCAGEEKEIIYLSDGKPYLKDGSYFISISHTRGYVAIALHPKVKVGIDIEQYGTKVQKLASRFIREDEWVSVQAGDEIYALLLHWSAKEAMFKLLEEEAVDFIDHLRILPFVPMKSGELLAEEHRTLNKQKFRIHYETHSEYVLTYACDTDLE